MGVRQECDQDHPAVLGSVETGEHRPHLMGWLIPRADKSLWDQRPKDGRHTYFLRDARVLYVFISEIACILILAQIFKCLLTHWQAEHSPARGLPVPPLQHGCGSRVDAQARQTSGNPGSAPLCDLGQGSSPTFTFFIHKMKIILVLSHNIYGEIK